MEKEMVTMEVITALVTITMPIVATVLLSGRHTQRIIQTSNRQTQRILGRLERCLIKLGKIQQEMYKDHHCLLRKIDIGLKANAHMHGWRREDGVTPERARQLPEPKVYDEELGVCYYRSD
jgi:hypothetical protein